VLVFTSEDYISFATNFMFDVRVFEWSGMAVVRKDSTVFAFFKQLSCNHYKMTEKRNQSWIDDILFYDEYPQGTNGNRLLITWSESFPNFEFVNVDGEIKMLRVVKHDEEIELMSKACSLTDWVQHKYIENIHPG